MLGLALEGGGAKGAFHMGVVKAFLEEGYEFGGITGTSIGAFNGAVIAQGDFEEGYKLWETMDTTLLFDIEEAQYKKLIKRELDIDTAIHIALRLKNFIEKKGIDTSKIRQVVESIVDEEKLRKSNMDYGLVTVSISDLKPLELYKEDIPEGKLIDYIMASASFPGFKLEPIENKYYIDGGFYDNCPINLLARKGYREIIAVRTLVIGIVQDIKYPDVKVTNIIPSEDLGKILVFDNNLIHRNLKMGYYDAMRSIKGLKGKKYYIKPLNEDVFLKILLSVPEKSIVKLGKLFGIKDMNYKRMLFEKIVPKIAEMAKVEASAAYQDIIICMLEKLAEENGVDRFNIYTFNDFLEEIKKAAVNPKNSSKERNHKIVRNTKLVNGLSRKIIFREAVQEIFNGIIYQEKQ